MGTVQKKSVLDTMTQKMVESQLWRSIFRHGYPDTPLNQSLVMMGNVFLHLHPVKLSRQAMKVTYTWCMGGITFFLFLLLTITGVFLMFFYVPDTTQAYANINQLATAVSFGHLVRNMHRWAAHLMVVTVTLHMIRVFYHGAYKPPREFNWVIGVLLFLTTLFLSFTGYLLPWDQIAIWAITVGTNLAPYAPILGDAVYKVLTGGSAVGQATLVRFYVGHVIFLPLIAALLMAVHFWRIRKDGGVAGPPPQSRREIEAQAERQAIGSARPLSALTVPSRFLSWQTACLVVAVMVLMRGCYIMSIEQREPGVQTQGSATQRRYRTLAVVKQEAITRVEKPLEDSVFVWPHLLVREFFASTILMVMITILSISIDAPLRDPANPNVTPNPAKAPWYFLGLQEVLHYFSPTTAGVLLPGFTLLGLMVLPYVDRNPSRAYADRKVAIITFTMFAVFWAVITLAGSFFRGPGWVWSWPWQHVYFDL